jgi:hypothetical protein
MTDTTDTTPAPPAGDIRARNKHILFAALAEAGIHRVTVEYDGSGDSGQIDTIEAWNAGNDRMPLPLEPRIQFVAENPASPSAQYNLEALSRRSPGTISTTSIAAGRTTTGPSAPSCSMCPRERSRSSTTSDTRKSTPPHTNSEGGTHGASLSSCPRLGEKMGRRRLRLSAASYVVRPVEEHRGGFPAQGAPAPRRGHIHVGYMDRQPPFNIFFDEGGRPGSP